MKKILLSAFLALFLTGCSVETIQNENTNKNVDVVTLFSSKSEAKNKAWVGTFQLVFNDMKNNIIKKDIKFVNENLYLVGVVIIILISEFFIENMKCFDINNKKREEKKI